MKWWLSFSLVGLVAAYLSCLAAGQTARPQPVQILQTGESFHGEEIKARGGERWLGLYVTKRGSELVESTITVRRARDIVVDEETGPMTGKSVTVNQSSAPIFLVRGPHGLKPGRVTTVFRRSDEDPYSLTTEKDLRLSLGKLEYRFKVTGRTPATAADVLPPAPKLLLFAGEQTQTLFSLKDETPDMTWYLIWAGDLDGDGKLDFYADLTSHYNLSERRLFLSSQAKPGLLVREVGKFRRSGC